MRDLSVENVAKGGRRSHPTETSFSSVVGTVPTAVPAPTTAAAGSSSATASATATTGAGAAGVAGSNNFETRLREQAVDISAQDRSVFRCLSHDE